MPSAAVAFASCLVSTSCRRRSGPVAVASPGARDLVIERLQWSKPVDGPEPITTFDVRNDFGDIRARRPGIGCSTCRWSSNGSTSAGDKVGFTVERRGNTIALVVSYPPGRVRDSVAQPAKDSYDRLRPRGVRPSRCDAARARRCAGRWRRAG